MLLRGREIAHRVKAVHELGSGRIRQIGILEVPVLKSAFSPKDQSMNRGLLTLAIGLLPVAHWGRPKRMQSHPIS